MESSRKSKYSILGSLGIAFTLPWMLFKLLRMIITRREYNTLIGKVVVITGASSGLGEACAHEFYRHGCQIVLCARRRNELERVRDDLLRTHCTFSTLPPIIVDLDLNDINALRGHVKKILSIVGQVDILINNGGVSHRGSAVDTKPDVDIKIMMVNYFGAVALTKAILPSMIRKQTGHVVFVSSVQGLIALPHRSAYSASKHALQAFADSLRAEVAKENVFVTVVSPGYINTELSQNALLGSGATYGKMDSTTLTGYSPYYVAEIITKAVVDRKKDVIIAQLLPNIAIFLRKYFPSWYFYLMMRRAEKSEN